MNTVKYQKRYESLSRMWKTCKTNSLRKPKKSRKIGSQQYRWGQLLHRKETIRKFKNHEINFPFTRIWKLAKKSSLRAHCVIFRIFPQKFARSVVILKPIGTDSQNPRTLRPEIYLNRQRHSLKLQARLVLMPISVVNGCTVKYVGAITWKSDWLIYYCGEVNKFWLGFDEIE